MRATPDELRFIAASLDDLADRLGRFPKYIRRDCGSTSVHARVIEMLREHGLEGNTALAEDILELTDKLRLTIRTYYEGQFLDDKL